MTDILTPVGRMVYGDCFKANTTDAEGKPLVVKFGANAGQPRVDYSIGIAIPKTDPGYPALRAQIDQVARASFPHLFDQQGNCSFPTFAFKITDGDSQVPNRRGNKPCDQIGYAGNWILNFSNGFAPKVVTAGGESSITDPEGLKRGYFIRIVGSVKGNGSENQPGVYLNHSMVEMVAYGEVIETGPDAKAILGATPITTPLPAGASATPLAPTTAPGAGYYSTPGTLEKTSTGDYLDPNAPPPPPPPAPEMTYPLGGKQYTMDQLIQAGYTLKQIEAL